MTSFCEVNFQYGGFILSSVMKSLNEIPPTPPPTLYYPESQTTIQTDLPHTLYRNMKK